MATALHQSTQRRLASVLGLGLLMAVVFLVPSLSEAVPPIDPNTCPENPAVAPLLTQCVTKFPPDPGHVTDCPTLCPGPNCVDTLQEAIDAAAANAPVAQVIGIFIKTDGKRGRLCKTGPAHRAVSQCPDHGGGSGPSCPPHPVYRRRWQTRKTMRIPRPKTFSSTALTSSTGV